MAIINLKINPKEKEYSIFIDNEPISDLKAKIMSYVRGKKVLVVVSEKVEKLYGKVLGFSKLEKFVLKDGEEQKDFKNYQKILKYALKLGLTRQDAIIAIGGGVVGDISGFVAATYMRGIDFIQVPTTLLACVDSSVGGKTAIDTEFGKNLVGCFYQPKVVLINTNFLKTLDERQYKTGLGEVVKYLFIEKSCNCKEDLDFTNFMTENIDKVLKRDLNVLKKLIENCIKLKAAVVEQDEKESGLRKILNFGHTYGHAVEKVTKYKKYTHGEAVVCGIVFAFNLAEKRGLIDKNYKFFADDVIKKYDFVKIPQYKMGKMIKFMLADKKSDGKSITFILPTDYSTVKAFEFSKDELL